MPEPITREEVYLNAIAQNTGGGSAGAVPEPITREEHYLNQIVTNTAGGGGGGGASLPEVTSEDNGNVLTVVEGAWAKAAPSGGVLVCMVDAQNTLNHTWQEIHDAPLAVIRRNTGGDGWAEDNLWYIQQIGFYEEDVEWFVSIGLSTGGRGDFVADSANGYPTYNGSLD